MARSENLVSFSEFPQDRKLRQIVNLGPVSRSQELDRGVVWRVVLKEVQSELDPDAYAQTFACHLSAGCLPFLKLGTLWRGQDLVGNYSGLKIFEDVTVDGEIQGLFRRLDCEESGLPTFFPEKEIGANAPIYLLVSISGVAGVNYAVVRCSELARFYFGMSSLLAQEMFNFDTDGRNDRLYDFERTTWNKDQSRFNLALKQTVRRDVGIYLAMQLAWEQPLEALIDLSTSARIAFFEENEVWPKMKLPFSGENEWSIRGQIRPMQITDYASTEHHEDVLAITQILSCSMNRKFPSLNLDLPRNLNKRELNPNTFPQPAVKPPGEKLPWTSEQLPGVSVRHSVTVSVDLFSGCPGMDYSECTISLDGERETEIVPQQFVAENQVDALSPVEGGVGTSSVGDVSVVPDIPTDKTETKVNQDEEVEPDRSALPNIFDDLPLESPREVLTPYSEVPNIFLATIHAAAKVQWHWGHTVATTYDGTHLAKDFAEIALLELPLSWGKPATNPSAPNGLRRALCIRMLSDFGQSFVLDMERVAGYDSFGIHLVHFPNHSLIPLTVLGKFFHWRLIESTCWPDRATHSGDFLVERIKHDLGIHAKVRMEGRIETHVQSIFDRFAMRNAEG